MGAQAARVAKGLPVSSIVEKSGKVRALEKAAEPDEQITPEQWQDVPRMTRLMTEVLRNLTSLLRRSWPQRVDHEDRAVDATGTVVHLFPHNFGGRVRWWVVDWTGATLPPVLIRHSSSTNDTLALTSGVAGTVTLRIEEAG